MSAGSVRLTIDGRVATITFDRPGMRNAMSLAMYDELSAACGRIASTPGLRAAVFRGANGAFVAGTDIAEFRAFKSGEDGVRYEARLERGVAEVEALPVPTLAVIDGPATGGGLMIATACDLRVASSRARFGVPIARTLGNCLSRANLMRLERAFGQGRTRRMLLLADLLDAERSACGGLSRGAGGTGHARNSARPKSSASSSPTLRSRSRRRARSCARRQSQRKGSSPASMAAGTSRRESRPSCEAGPAWVGE